MRPRTLYGRPDDMRRFVDAAHVCGIGVILDVVYNHIGPDGNYLKRFAEEYFTDKHKTDWGEAINFYDDRFGGPVREFFIHNAGYWIDEFHLDGLRLDATQNIYDESDEHVIAALTRHARAKAGKRSIVVVGENEPQEAKLVRADREGRLRTRWPVERRFSSFGGGGATRAQRGILLRLSGAAGRAVGGVQARLSVSGAVEPVAEEAARNAGSRYSAVGVHHVPGKSRPGFELAVRVAAAAAFEHRGAIGR